MLMWKRERLWISAFRWLFRAFDGRVTMGRVTVRRIKFETRPIAPFSDDSFWRCRSLRRPAAAVAFDHERTGTRVSAGNIQNVFFLNCNCSAQLMQFAMLFVRMSTGKKNAEKQSKRTRAGRSVSTVDAL